MDDHLEMDYEDRNGDPDIFADTISYPYYGDDDDEGGMPDNFGGYDEDDEID